MRGTPNQPHGSGRAPLHRNFARKYGREATHCEGIVRRMFVRVGGGKYYVAIGHICDGCGWASLDGDRLDRIDEHKAKF